MITRRDFIEQFGQDPVDLFGPDWRNYVQYFIEEKNKTSRGLDINEPIG